MRRTCWLQHGRRVQRALRGHAQQLIVRDAAPQEERQPRRQLEIADAVDRCPARRPPDRARRGTRTSGWPESAAAPSECRSRSVPCLPARQVEVVQRARGRRRVTWPRYARRASVATIRRAHASSVDRLSPAGTTKILRRLGVSPGPVGLNGPVSVNVSRCGCPIVSSVSFELRMNGCSRSGLTASLRSRNATVMTCGPALSGMRMCARASTSSPAFVMFLRLALKSSSPPTLDRCTRAPSTVNSS